MSQKQKTVAYARAPETIGEDLPYEEKFSDFQRAVADAKANEANNLVIASPWVIGDTYEEIIESLSLLAASSIGLLIVRR
jgi:hypothetical protein